MLRLFSLVCFMFAVLCWFIYFFVISIIVANLITLVKDTITAQIFSFVVSVLSVGALHIIFCSCSSVFRLLSVVVLLFVWQSGDCVSMTCAGSALKLRAPTQSF